MKRHTRRDRLRIGMGLLLMVLTVGLGLAGCDYVAHVVAGGERTVDVTADYRGLDNQRVAVLVAASEQMLYHYPQAPSKINQAVSAHLVEQVPGVTVTNPSQMIDFQINNPFWNSIPYSQLVKQMDVDRLVVVDLSEYRTHEPGNAHLWKGHVSGSILVIDANAADPDVPVYQQDVTAEFPEDRKLGIPEHSSDYASIELGMVTLFARNTTHLFYDHKETR